VSDRATSSATSAHRDLRGPVVVAGAVLAVAALLRVRDPHDAGSYGFCPFLSLTGLPCPGCGGLRAVNDLTRGDVVAAASSNALAVALVLGLTVAWAIWTARRSMGDRAAPLIVVNARAALAVVTVVLLFGVLRNTPWGAWFAP